MEKQKQQLFVSSWKTRLVKNWKNPADQPLCNPCLDLTFVIPIEFSQNYPSSVLDGA